MTAHDIVGGVVWVQALVLMAAIGFAVFEMLFVVSGGRRHFLTRRRLSIVACSSVVVGLLALPLMGPLASSINVTDAILAQYLKGNLRGMTAMEMQAMVDMRMTLVDDLARGASWLGLALIAVFSAAALARLAYLALNLSRIRAALRGSCTLRKTARLHLMASPHVKVPFSTRGLRRYIVVLPADVCHDPIAMRMYLGHELQHIRQGDVDTEILLSVVSPLFVLNPGFWYVAGRVRNLSELACDRAYLSRQRVGARDYSLRLLATARSHLAARRSGPTAFGVPFIGRALPWRSRRSILKSRIEEIAADLEETPREGLWLAGAASLAMICVILVVAAAVGGSGDWSHERIMLSTVVNLERIDALNTLAQRSW